MSSNEPRIQDELRSITECFTGADGGISFLKFKVFVETLEEQYIGGDYKAGEVLNIVSKFNQLIEIANREVVTK